MEKQPESPQEASSDEINCECRSPRFRSFFKACNRGDLQAVRDIIRRHEEDMNDLVNHQQFCCGDHPFTPTPFETAAINGHVDVVEFLLDNFDIELTTSVTHQGQSAVDLLIERVSQIRNPQNTQPSTAQDRRLERCLELLLTNFQEFVDETFNSESDMDQCGWFDLLEHALSNHEQETSKQVLAVAKLTNEYIIEQIIGTLCEHMCDENKNFVTSLANVFGVEIQSCS